MKKSLFSFYFVSFVLFFFVTNTLAAEPEDDLVKYIHSNIDQYQLTCADTPVVDVVRSTCSTDAGGEGAPYGKITQIDPSNNKEYIDVQAIVNLATAKLGGYGPDASTQGSRNLDALAKVYPYNAFLNSPLQPNVPREASGTFWRLLNQFDQMNAKAKLFYRYQTQLPPLGDQDIVYAGNKSDQEREADGALVAKYMNDIIAGVGGNAKIKLLSPAFNITSRFTPPLIAQMLAAGANFSSLAGCAGNTYTVDGQGAYSWFRSFLSQTGLAGQCRGFVFTEFGDFDTFGKTLDARPDLISRMSNEFNQTMADASIMGALYFNALGGNPGFTGHKLSQNEYRQITGANPAKGGVNSAMSFDGGTFQTAAANYAGGGWTLEIAFSPGDEDSVASSINQALAKGLTPIVRICAGNTCDFADSDVYVEFLKKVASKTTGSFYAIAGPNEPESEQWIASDGPPTPPPKTIKLSSLMSSLPSCLVSFPVCNDAVSVHEALDPDTKIKYDALIPFNQDNLRGYLALNYIEPVTGRTNVGILTEGLPYVETIKEVLDDPNFGIVNALSPGWTNDARANQTTSEQYITPNGEKNNRSLIEKIADKARQIWPSDTVDDNPSANQLGCYLHPKGVSLPAPTTYPKDFPVTSAKPEWEIKSEPFPQSLYQFVRVPVETKETANSDRCIIRDRFGREIGRGTYYETRVISGSDRRDPNSYIVSNIGRSIAVLNNPKMTDISRLISEPKDDSNYSLNSMMLPGLAKKDKFINTPLLAPEGSYDSTIYVYTDSATQDSAAAGKSGKDKGVIARIGGQAHSDLCVLRNFWLRPAGLQRGTIADCSADAETLLSTPSLPDVVPPSQKANRARNKVPENFLNAIWTIETNRAPSGSNCDCSGNRACGPMSINEGAFNAVTSDAERGVLDRCNLSDAFEIAARVLLYKKYCTLQSCTFDRNDPSAGSVDATELFTAARYNGSDGCYPNNETQCRWGTGITYCDAITAISNGTTLPTATPAEQALYCH